jgi:hypothetical protein
MLAVVTLRSSTAPYQWHGSSHFSRVIVNATEGVESRPREWFAQDKLVTDFRITGVNSENTAAAQQRYAAIRSYAVNTLGLAVGTYVSGISVIPEAKEAYWPWAVVPIEWMPATSKYSGNWPDLPFRKLIDVSDPATRQALQAGIKRLWEQSPAPVRFIDNAAIHRSVGPAIAQPWIDYCKNIQEISKLAESKGSLAIFNLALNVGEMSDEETTELVNAVGSGGIMLEAPLAKGIQRNPAATDRAKKRYRQLLDTGMGIIMAPPGYGPSQELVDWVNTWRKPSDHLYFAGVFYKQPDEKLFGSQTSK